MTAPARRPKQTIRQLRQERDWSQLALAVQIGASVNTVYKWERSLVVPRPKSEKRGADVFGVRVTETACGEREPP